MPNRSPITDMVKKAKAMVFHVQENLSAEEYAVFLDMVDPLPEEAAPAKKSQKKAGKKSSKSPRATGIEQQLSKRRGQGRAGTATDDEDGPRCTRVMGDDQPCNSTEHSPIHREDGGYLSWHPFQHAVAPAPTRSPANGASSVTESGTRRSAPSTTPESDGGEGRSASLSVVNSEASAVSAGAATGGSSDG